MHVRVAFQQVAVHARHALAAEILRDRLPVIPIFTYAAPMLVAPDLRGVARGDAMTGWSGQDIWRAAEQGDARKLRAEIAEKLAVLAELRAAVADRV